MAIFQLRKINDEVEISITPLTNQGHTLCVYNKFPHSS